MYQNFKEAIDALWFPAVVAVVGYVMKCLYRGVKSLKKFLATLPVVAFSGIVAYWFLNGSGVNPEIIAAVIGISGWSGGAIMEVAFDRVARVVSGEHREKSDG